MRKIVPHIVIIFSGMLIVLLVSDFFNKNMAFFDNDMTRFMVWVLIIAAMHSALRLIIRTNGSRKN